MSVSVTFNSSKVSARLLALANTFPQAAAVALNEVAEVTMTDAKERTPVQYGRLKASGMVAEYATTRSLKARLAFGTEYACVMGSNTAVTIHGRKGGCKGIGVVGVGDRVLTQTGEFREVLATNRFPARLKPSMVDVVAEWRSDRDHRLTLTSDHKVLSLREGRRQWIHAGDLLLSDLVFSRKKISPFKGTRDPECYTEVKCSTCAAPFTVWAGRLRYNKKYFYCSMACRNEGYSGDKHPSLGLPRDMSPARTGLAEKRRNGGTDRELAVERWLIRRGLAYVREYRIGSRHVDFYVPSMNLVVEADGGYWHQDQRKDVERDAAILAAGPDGLEIIHVHFYSDSYSPKNLVEHPIPGVSYVACNPGPDTFVDPEVFEAVPIKSLRPWRYVVGGKGSNQSQLYDLSVEGVHSFVASGIVVSNCYVHERLELRHKVGEAKFLERALAKTARTFVADIKAKVMQILNG